MTLFTQAATHDTVASPLLRTKLCVQGKPELEVGCDAGQWLTERALRYKERTFVGIECSSRARTAHNRAARMGLANVDIIEGDAHAFVCRWRREPVFSSIYVLFPTPYPRSLGYSRRLVTVQFLDGLARLAAPGAILRIATDHTSYFKAIESAVFSSVWDRVPWQPVEGVRRGYLVDTPCERRYREAGCDIHALSCISR